VLTINGTNETGKARPLREQQRAYTRKRLMEAAGQVFAARGYPDATVDEIASEAGASRATFYLHFKSKTDLVAALVAESIPFSVERYRLLDQLLVRHDANLRDDLHEWLSGWLGIWRESADSSHALLQAAMLEPEVEELRLRNSEELVDALGQYFAGLPEADREPARERLLILEIMSQRIFSLASVSRLPIDNKHMLTILTDMWLHALVGG
jgi:AcrR family transcriptional regulator